MQGSRVRPYRVAIALTVLSELVWAKAETALSEQALPSAKLLAGEVPPELEDLFAGAGAPPFPRVRGRARPALQLPGPRGALQAPRGDLLSAGRGL